MTVDSAIADSPFHRGELAVQERLGVRQDVDPIARRMVRDHLPEQHRTFYERLSFLLLGATDADGRVWASVISGPPGFVSSPDPHTLHIAAGPHAGDPVLKGLPVGADIGILGIELETRRRNRAVGRIADRGPDGLTVAVDRTFGNCPQYIQPRSVEAVPGDGPVAGAGPVARSNRFDRRIVELIETVDTFFIATAFRDDDGAGGAGGKGADVSHRGGPPGFVRVEDDRTFSFPDYPGNRHFNTLGNILLNPNAGILFMDFETGDIVHMTGTAEILWKAGDASAPDDADRRVRFRAAEILWIRRGLPLQFNTMELSRTRSPR